MTVEIDEKELEQLQKIAARSELLDEACGIGLWQAILVDRDAMHPDSQWNWSPEFRRLLGYSSEQDFPEVVQSWSDKLHPDDVEATFAAFAGHLEDRTGRARYDVKYRLKMRTGEYRWFRATGGCKYMPDGQVRACGSLYDIHENEVLHHQIEQEAQEDALALDMVAESLGRLANGDLTVEMSGELPAKMSRLKEDFNASVSQLRNMIVMVKQSLTELNSAAESMRADSGSLSSRSADQASSLEETSAAVVEITSTVQQTADLAQKSATSAQGSRDKAVGCGQVVQESISKMSEIETSSGKIGSIIGTIEDIAFQTNMLALNAAVEAARAGDAGRGFAVVAAEVRSLAQRSSDSVREITDLVTAAKNHVAEGVTLVRKTGDAVEEISVEASSIADAVQSISVAASEQSTALTEIERAISQLDQLTQKNALMSQQNENTAEDLTGTLGRINQIVSRFRTPEAHNGVTAAA